MVRPEARIKRTSGRTAAWLLVGLACWAVAPGVRASEVRYHGGPLDENHRLLIEEENGICRVGILERSRFAGEDLTDIAQAAPGVSPRVNPKPDFLVEVRAQVVKPSAPNYLQNPGERYRLSIQTLKLRPTFADTVEVSAEYARDMVFYLFDQLRVRTTGIEQRAVEMAAPLVVDIFKEEQRLPAEIYTSVLRSRSGQYRIVPETQQRRSIPPSQVFAPKPEFGRPVLGATKRQRERQAIPDGTVQPFAMTGPLFGHQAAGMGIELPGPKREEQAP
jgi:hypothetical protein